MWRKLAAAVLCTVALGGAAQAEVSVVNMSKQFGLPYLPMIVIEAQHLIEKNAKAAGLGDVKTTWTQRAGPAAELDALGQDGRHTARSARADCHAIDAVRAGDAQSER